MRFFHRALSPARGLGVSLLFCSLGACAQESLTGNSSGANASTLPQAPSAILGLNAPGKSWAAGNDAPRLTAELQTDAPVVRKSASTCDRDAGEAAAGGCLPEKVQQGAGEPSTPASQTSRTGQQPKRILGLMPNYRSVSSGTVAPPPTIKQSFRIATRQAFDYSSFVFLGITSAAAYAQDSHPSLDTYNGGDAVFWAYIWRGFLDKTDGNYLAAFILPTLLREDTRYYAMGEGSKWRRLGYAASRVAVARTYGGRTTPNIAGLGGKVAAQAISPFYYPPGSSDFGVLATKFAYAVARDMGFTVFREFYPDIAIHVLHRNP